MLISFKESVKLQIETNPLSDLIRLVENFNLSLMVWCIGFGTLVSPGWVQFPHKEASLLSLERWLRGEKLTLLFQRTQVQSLIPTSGDLQTPLTSNSISRRSDPLVWPLWAPVHMHVFLDTDRHEHINKQRNL